MPDTFFEGLKIIELATVLAGPSVGMFFSELGANVIKIENKKSGGDVTRKWKLPSEDKKSNYSAYFSSINYRKKHFYLDLKNEDDYSVFLEMFKDADIILSNFSEKQAEKLKVDYPYLSKTNPGIIYSQLNGFGTEDNRPAFDVVLQAEAGFMYMNGEPERPPVKMPVALIDILAAHQMKESILMALLKKEKTGQGSFITTSLYESAVASLANQASNWLMAEHIAQPIGTLHPNIAPYGEMFTTKDGKQLVLAVGSDLQFEALCKALGLDLYKKSDFQTNTQRVRNRKELAEYLEDKINKKDSKSLEKDFSELRVPYGRIRNMKEVFENPLAKKMILEEEMQDGNISKRVSTIAFEFKK